MKKFFSAIAALMVFGLIACGGHAGAATLSESFNSTDGKVFSIHNVESVSQEYANSVTLRYADGSSSYSYFADQGGVVWARIISNPGFANSFVKISATRWLNVNTVMYVVCQNQQTQIALFRSQPETINDPGCVIFSQIQAAAK